MIVAVIAVRMMQVAVDEIVDVIPVRDRFMATSRPMHMPRVMPAAFVIRRTGRRICLRDLDHVFVDVAGMQVMQMPIVQIIDVISVLHRRMSASRSMLMGVIGVMRKLAVCHVRSPFVSVHNT